MREIQNLFEKASTELDENVRAISARLQRTDVICDAIKRGNLSELTDDEIEILKIFDLIE